jgi:protein-S-isoprenylcysteine O-methyltransferase Ste14
MLDILKKQNGMNIVGQGGRIILFVLPSLIAAILVDTYLTQIATLPESISFIKLVASVFLYVGVMIFIGPEEKQLTEVFGRQYEEYMARVDRLVPFKRP